MNHPKKVTLSDLAIEALSKKYFDLIKEIEVVAKGTELKKNSDEIIIVIGRAEVEKSSDKNDDGKSLIKMGVLEIRTTLKSVLAFIAGLTLLIEGKLTSELMRVVYELFE